MNGYINQILYTFSRHFLFGRTIIQWLVIGLLVSPFLCALSVFGQSPWRWAVLAGFLLVSLALLYAIWRVRRAGYIDFEAEPITDAITPERLPFPEKLQLYITGNLNVNKAKRYFVNEVAHYQTFQTRERVIMLEMAPSRLLLLAVTRESGWWYAFFFPGTVQSLAVGQLSYGRHRRPTIALTILPEEAATPEILYLSFDSTVERARLLADLFEDDLQTKMD